MYNTTPSPTDCPEPSSKKARVDEAASMASYLANVPLTATQVADLRLTLSAQASTIEQVGPDFISAARCLSVVHCIGGKLTPMHARLQAACIFFVAAAARGKCDLERKDRYEGQWV